MSNRALTIIAILALVVESVFTPIGAKSVWLSIALVVGFNFGLALLWYAAAGRFTDSETFVPGIDKSTKDGLIGIALFGLWSAVFALVLGLFLWPLLQGDSPTVDYSVVHWFWPTMIFTDVVSLLLRRWRSTLRTQPL